MLTLCRRDVLPATQEVNSRDRRPHGSDTARRIMAFGPNREAAGLVMEPTGIEPVTSCLQSARSPARFQRRKLPICRDFWLSALARRWARMPVDYRRLSWFRALSAMSAWTITPRWPQPGPLASAP